MPLTPAHAAAAPLLQRLVRPFGLTLPLSALVIGTMMPDFAYLIRLNPGGGPWHTPLGLLAFCLPVGVAIWWVHRIIIGPALLRLLPPGLGAAAGARVAPGPTHRLLPGAALAVLLGAVSHDLWDSFTHESSWGVRLISGRDATVPVASIARVPWYEILQYASSVLGLIVIVVLGWRWVMAQPREARQVPPGEGAWRVREMGMLVLAGVAGAVLNASRMHPPSIQTTFGLTAVGGMSALAAALLAYGVVDLVRSRREG